MNIDLKKQLNIEESHTPQGAQSQGKSSFDKAKTLKYLGFTALVVLALLILSGVTNLFKAKQAYELAIAGKNDLETAVTVSKKADFENANSLAKQANTNFIKSEESVANLQNSFIASIIPFAKKQLASVDNLLKTGVLVSGTASEGTALLSEIKTILDANKAADINNLDTNSRAQVLEKISQSDAKLNNIKKKIDEAVLSINKVETNGLLWPMSTSVAELKDRLIKAQAMINQSIPLSKIGLSIVGYPQEARYLVLLSNSDRLRPIGGTIGTYGIVTINQGKIISYELYDANYLDILSKNAKIAPPADLAKLTNTNNWLFKDVNWNPDWVFTAKKAEQLYRTKILSTSQGDKCPMTDCNLEFNGIINITPELTTDLLAITGPVEVNDVNYDKDNFVRLYEQELDKAYADAGKYTAKKLLIGEISRAVQIKLATIPFSSWPELGSVLSKNADAKNILIYSKDPAIEKLLAEQNWAGELKKTANDYLMVVDSNVPAVRLNKDVDESVNYEVVKAGDSLKAKLTVKYTYVKNQETKSYKNYVRVYAPLNSKLTGAAATSKKIETFNETGKTVFGTEFEIKPGTSFTYQLEYDLPQSVITTGKYALLIQKQPGGIIKELKVYTTFDSNILSIGDKTGTAYKLSNQKAYWKTDVLEDKVLEINTK